MLQATLQDLLQDKLDEQIGDHKIYLVSDYDSPIDYPSTEVFSVRSRILPYLNLDEAFLKENLFYIGQTQRNPKERIAEHLFPPRKQMRRNLGTYIIYNLPVSLSWNIRFLTLKDCEQFVLLNKDAVYSYFWTYEEKANDNIQYIMDSLFELFPDSPNEADRIRNQLLEASCGSCGQKEDAVREVWARLRSIGKELPKRKSELCPKSLVLEMLYNPKYTLKFSELIEKILIGLFKPCLNIAGGVTPFRTLPTKYVTTGLNF